MARVDTSVEIAAPAALVFAFFVPQRMPYWYGADMGATLEVQGGASDFAVSQKVRISGNLGRREVAHVAVVTALQQARVLEWRFEDRYGVKGLERWELQSSDMQERAGAGKTTVRMRSEYALPGFVGTVMDWLVTRHAVARRNQNYLLRLKRLAQRGSLE